MNPQWMLVGLALFALADVHALGAQDPVVSRSDPPALAADTITLSLPDARRLALRQNPGYRAARQTLGIARGDLRQARTYPFNPELELEAPGAASSRAFNAYEARLTQSVEWAGQRGLRVQAARTGLGRVDAEVRDAARATLGEVSTAYLSAFASERRLAITRQVLAQSERLVAATRTQLQEGEISTLEANLAEIEFGRIRARVLAAERETSSARLSLRRTLGLHPEQPLRLTGEHVPAPDIPHPAEDSLVARALAHRPDLAARTAAVAELRTLSRLAAREALPNLSIGALVGREAPDGSAGVGLLLGVTLPIFDRRQGVRLQRAAQVEQAVLEARAVQLAVRAEVADALRAYQSASEEAAVLEAAVLEPARRSQALLEIAFEAGKLGLPELLLLRNQLLDAELGYWETWLALQNARVALEVATASLLGDFSQEGTDER